jgi:N utilization substance protein A
MKFTLDVQTLQWISLFEKITRARVRDCFMLQDKLTFIVEKGDLHKALGKEKKTLRKLEGLYKKRIKIIQYDEDVERFICNVLSPLKVVKMEMNDEGIVTITGPDEKTKGLMIGAQAKNLRSYEAVVHKYYPQIKELKVI